MSVPCDLYPFPARDEEERKTEFLNKSDSQYSRPKTYSRYVFMLFLYIRLSCQPVVSNEEHTRNVYLPLYSIAGWLVGCIEDDLRLFSYI